MKTERLSCYVCGSIAFLVTPSQKGAPVLYFAVRCVDGHVTKKAFRKRHEAIRAFKRGEVQRG